MPNILLITTAFTPPPSAGASRTQKFLNWLPKYGWSPTLLTICWDGMESGLERLPGDPSCVHRVAWQARRKGGGRSEPKDSGQLSGSAPSTQRLVFIRKVYRILARLYRSIFVFPDGCRDWIAPGVARGLELAHKTPFDLIYSSAAGPGVSAHFIASELQRKLNIPWIHEYRDLWSGNPWSDMKSYWWRERWERSWERRFLVQADRAVVMTPSNAEILATRGPEGIGSRIVIVPNGFDADEFAKDVPQPRGFPLQLCFTGSLYGGKRDLGGLFAGMRMLVERGTVDRNEIQFTYAGASSALVHALAEREGVADLIADRGVVAGPAAKQIQQMSHVLVLAEADDDDPWVLGNMPAKAYEYLGAARPVLVLANQKGAIAQLYAETHAGCTFLPRDRVGIADHIAGWIGELRANGVLRYAPDEVAVSQQSWRERSALLARLLDEVLQEKRAKTTV